MTTTAPADEMMTVRELSAYLRVGVATVTRWCRVGHIPAAKIGKEYRVRRSDLEKWLADLYAVR